MIIINARRWFNRTHGNTYHSVSVFDDSKLVGRVDYTYGYGEQYLQTAHEILQGAGYYPKTDRRLASGIDTDWYEFSGDMIDNRDKFHVTCVDVTRKKDL